MGRSLLTTDFKDFWVTGNLWKDLNDTVELDNIYWFSTISFHCTAPTWWEVCFEASFDWTSWERISIRSITDDIFVNCTDDDSDFIWSISWVKKFRFKVITAWSANWTVIWRMQKDVTILEWIEFWNPPHRFWFLPIHKDWSYTTAQTWTAIRTPTSWKKVVVTDMTLVFSWATDWLVKIFDETDSSWNYLYKWTVDVSVAGWWRINHISFSTPYVSSAIDNVIKITTWADINIDVILHWYEV